MLPGVNVNHNWKGSVENGAFLYKRLILIYKLCQTRLNMLFIPTLPVKAEFSAMLRIPKILSIAEYY